MQAYFRETLREPGGPDEIYERYFTTVAIHAARRVKTSVDLCLLLIYTILPGDYENAAGYCPTFLITSLSRWPAL